MSEKILNFGSKEISYIIGGSVVLLPLLDIITNLKFDELSGDFFSSVYFVLGAYLLGLLIKEFLSFTPIVQQRTPVYSWLNKWLYKKFEGTNTCPEYKVTNSQIIEFNKVASKYDLTYISRIIHLTSIENCVGSCLLVSILPWSFSSIPFNKMIGIPIMIFASIIFLALARVKNIQRHTYIWEYVEKFKSNSGKQA